MIMDLVGPMKGRVKIDIPVTGPLLVLLGRGP